MNAIDELISEHAGECFDPVCDLVARATAGLSALMSEIHQLRAEVVRLQGVVDDMESREYDLTRRALDTTPAGREFLGKLSSATEERDQLRAELSACRGADDPDKPQRSTISAIREVESGFRETGIRCDCGGMTFTDGISRPACADCLTLVDDKTIWSHLISESAS